MSDHDYIPVPRIELPDDWTPEGTICALVNIPDDPQYLAMLIGLVDQMRYSASFARDSTRTGAATVARTWDAALHERPILTVDCEGAMTVFDVRQNEENPCILEKSTDGGVTWVPWADLTHCPPNIQPSSDGTGTQWWDPDCNGGAGCWVPLQPPGSDTYDPAYDDAQSPVEDGWVEPGEVPCCVFAANVTEAFKSVMERIDFGLETGTLAQIIWIATNGIYGIANRLLSKKVKDMLQTIAQYVTMDYATWHADYEDFDWSSLTDMLCCAFSEDGTVSLEDFTTMQAVMASEDSPVWGMLKLLLNVVGPVGLNNAATYAGITAADCTPDCDPELNLCWDFAVDDFTFIPVADKGVYDPGDGWRGELFTDGNYWLDMTQTGGFPAGTIDEMRLNWVTTGGGKFMQVTVNGVVKAEVVGGSAGGRWLQFAVGEPVTSVRIILKQNALNTDLRAVGLCFYHT